MLYFILHLTLFPKKLNNVLQESKKLNVPTGINVIINFYDRSKMLVFNITPKVPKITNLQYLCNISGKT